MKVEHEAKLDVNEMIMHRSMCGFKLKDKYNTAVKELFGLELVSLSVEKNRLCWFERVECEDDAD